MYHDTFGSAVGSMGCVPRLALLVILCLPPRLWSPESHNRGYTGPTQ